MSFNQYDPFNFKFVVDNVDYSIKTEKMSLKEMNAQWHEEESLYQKRVRLERLKSQKTNGKKTYLREEIDALEAEIEEYKPSRHVEEKLNEERPLPKSSPQPKGVRRTKKQIEEDEKVKLEVTDEDLKLQKQIKERLKGFSFSSKINVPLHTFAWRDGKKRRVRISDLDEDEVEDLMMEIKDEARN